ncbi:MULTISPECIES: alanine--tRNA ligase [Terrabacteria group]|uniref:alanine--tRNA ligase n=1 Tax=Bacillati TaxID=1783272 RepID=UPI001C6E30B5|nr:MULTISPECIES: alanine--tRNA ligase [Terrabacteria group]MBW9211851.1 alanine--tRNA ligase [Trueperella sp. zg.1013]
MSKKKLTGNEVRQLFLDFFASKGCMIEPGASLVPHDDPTLLWINAGVAALKPYFDGRKKPASHRICNAQKSIRTNDIENVGKTARHHTFFEMLGNFSIGDYFKVEAISWAWQFLTSKDYIGFEPERLYVTVYPDDQEAIDTWVKVGMIPSHIRKTDDNFWEIGRGPGGPDTELYYDRGEKYDPEGKGEELFFKDLENDRYIEVWNIVFSQYDCHPGEMPRSEYPELPQKNIDTGMGLERLVALIQEGETNFDTDLFLPIIQATEKLSKFSYSDEKAKMAYRVIADHIRTVTFAIADGAMFSNEGRGYILRRVLRRAVRFGLKLGIEGAFMYQLVEVVAKNMEAYYPYVVEKIDLISKLVKMEEEAFHRTLSMGENLLQSAMNQHQSEKKLPGDVVFQLYDTYGFPFELTKEISSEAGYVVDEEGFKAQMKAQKERARKARGEQQSMHGQSEDLLNFEAESNFVGYDQKEMNSSIIALFKDGERVSSLLGEGDVVLKETVFYAESGGQCADTGILSYDGQDIQVTDVQKAPNGQFLHHVNTAVELKEGFKIHGQYDYENRELTRANHSSLHLLQAALKKVLGDHVAQAGSYNCPSYARFDFNHFEKMSEEQLKEVEDLVNDQIMANIPVTTEVLAIEDAKKSGATALFDEKYGDFVRVVSMGDFSKEFCGGTHVQNTSELGLFHIESEESIGSGVRRITSTTKKAAFDHFKEMETYLKESASLLKLKKWNTLQDRIHILLEENASLQSQIKELKVEKMKVESEALLSKKEEIHGLNVLILELQGQDNSGLKDYAVLLRNKLENGFVLIANTTDDKVVFVAAASPAAIAKGVCAGDVVKKVAQLTGGNGGGKPDLAQAGGKEVDKVNLALKSIRESL